MKHIMIVTFGFAPANNMAAHRNTIRAKGFDEQGYRVSVVTRPWLSGQTWFNDTEVSPREIVAEKLFANTTVYRVPYGSDRLPDLSGAQRLALRLARGKHGAVYKKLVDNLCYFTCPLDYGYRLAFRPEELAAQLDSPPDFVLASGNPWSCFDAGRRLARFFNAKFVAEYRDPWNYDDDRFRIEGFNTYQPNVVSQLKRRLSAARERRLNHDADLIIAASAPFLENALAMTGASRGMVVTNGFDRAEVDQVGSERYDRFTLCYIGTIYSQQRAGIFFEGLQTFIDRFKIAPDTISVKMIGSKLSHGFEKTLQHIAACRDYRTIVEFTDRLDKKASLRAQKSSAVLLYFAHEKTVGIIPGKFFEYIAVGTPILLVPSDHGELETIIRTTRTGTACETVEETVAFLEQAYFSWKKTGKVTYEPDREAVEAYSYKEITRRLIAKLEEL